VEEQRQPPRLSTPSLGITVDIAAEVLKFLNKSFNSLSRDHALDRADQHLTDVTFQLPLSGSLIAPNSATTPVCIFPFNSLSRDHRRAVRKPRTKYATQVGTFNSLSRDHQIMIDIQQNEILADSFNSLSRDHW